MRESYQYSRRLKHFAVIFFCVLSFSSNVFAQQKPKILLSSVDYNYSNIVEGAKVQHDFSIKNQGDADLVIQRVMSGCGCTAVNATASTLKPGEEGTISVTFDSTGLSGKQDKSVRIYTNDPDNAISLVTLSGTVNPELVIDPDKILFENLSHGQTEGLTKEISLRVRNASTVKMGDVYALSKYLKIISVVGNEQEKKVVVELDSKLPIGEFRDRIVVALKDGHRKSINIPVFASVRGALKISPPAVSFGIILGNEVLSRQVRITHTGSGPFKIVSAESADDAVSVKFQLADDGKAYIVGVQVDPSKVSRDLRTSIKLQTEGIENQDTLTLNVYGVLPPKL